MMVNGIGAILYVIILFRGIAVTTLERNWKHKNRPFASGIDNWNNLSYDGKNIFKPLSKRSTKNWVYPESCWWCECSSTDFSEWTCEGSLKL